MGQRTDGPGGLHHDLCMDCAISEPQAAAVAPIPLRCGTAIDLLRARTREQHRAIEMLMRMDADFSLAHYSSALQAFESFLAQWEPLVTNALPSCLQSWARSLHRLGLARRDMAALSIPPLPHACIDLDLTDKAAALGSMYVLEGSTLGGLVIAQRLASRHGIDAHNGGAYFSGWGTDTPMMWRSFRQRLESEIGSAEEARMRAATAAAATFEALSMTLRRSFDARDRS